MFVYFNKEGVIKEIINDSSIRQGNANVNTVYFFIEGADPQTSTDANGIYYKALYFSLGRYTMYLLDEHGEPLPSIEGVSFDITTVKMEVPYDKKKELKYFKYFTRYEMFQLPIPQEVLNYKGTVGLKFQMVNNDAIDTQGLIVFNIEGTSPDLEIASDTAITIAEWNYLLANMLTPEDVYTKAEANSTFQEKLIAGENITIEDNVISATGGAGSRAEWGYISGNIEAQTDLQTELSGKQDTLTFDNTPTNNSSNPVTSDGIYDAVQNVREVAEGKCQTFVLSYIDSLVVVKNEIQSNPNVKVFNGSGTDITQAVLNGDYDNQTFGNANFNSQANQIFCFQSPYSTYLIVRVNGGYMFLQYSDVINRKKGDIYLVIQTDVPDRWYGDEYTLYKLETSKIDLTNYVDLASAQTITGTKSFALSDSQEYKGVITPLSSGFKLGTNVIDSLRFAGYGMYAMSKFIPEDNGTLDLGQSDLKWKDLYLSNAAHFGSKWSALPTSSDYILTLQYDGVNYYNFSNADFGPRVTGIELGTSSSPWGNFYLGGKSFYYNSNTAKYAFTTLDQWGNLNVGLNVGTGDYNYFAFSNTEFFPTSSNSKNLGSSSYVWNYAYVNNLSNGTGDLTSHCNLNPSASGVLNLGSSSTKWQNIYLSGVISDGTNAVSVAQIASGLGGTYRHRITIEITSGYLEIAVNLNSNTAINSNALFYGIINHILGLVVMLDVQSTYTAVSINSVDTTNGTITYLTNTGPVTENIIDVGPDTMYQL